MKRLRASRAQQEYEIYRLIVTFSFHIMINSGTLSLKAIKAVRNTNFSSFLGRRTLTSCDYVQNESLMWDCLMVGGRQWWEFPWHCVSWP